LSVVDCAGRFWHRFDIRSIEDLSNAVLGAELEAIQMAGPRVGGSLAFAAQDGIIFSSGLINGSVAIRGPLSRDAVTVGLGLRFGPGSRHWLNEVSDGDVGIFLPGDEHDAIYTAGSLYVAATLAPERLEEEALREGLVLDPKMLARTGLHAIPLPLSDVAWISRGCVQIHDMTAAGARSQLKLGRALLRTVVDHYGRVPTSGDGRVHPKGRARIVHRAREYIRENLAAPISLDVLATVTGTSRRTLHRAFSDVIDDTPQNYVRRLRLHRIRRELVLRAEVGCTVSAIAQSWGAGTDLGRLSARYQQLFGESPSTTLAVYRERLRASAPL
jgi:AraC-like DNA-binding protein